MSALADRLRSEIRAGLPERLPSRIGVAVSGGGDSVALLHLMNDVAHDEGIELRAATVNHRLRAEAATEALWVSDHAKSMGVSHDILEWHGWDNSGNLQDQARRARYDLLTDWTRRNQIGAVALGHTADDQAETFLMRLGRAAGVTGLSGMSTVRDRDGFVLLRPMLKITRQTLREYLTEIGVEWIEDPSNQDRRFDRVKARDGLVRLGEIGITVESLARVADNLAQARDALDHFTQESAAKVLVPVSGDVCLDREGFDALPQEIQRRLLIGCIRWIAGGDYPPRQSAVDVALHAIKQGSGATLGGCVLVTKAQKTWICRELNAISYETCDPDQTWDKRWILSGPSGSDLQVKPLGEEGIAQVSGWRDLGKPRAALVASPAIWHKDVLISAPLAGFGNGWRAEIVSKWPDFHSSFLSH